MTLNELSRWTSTVVPSDFVTVTSYPFWVKSVVTAPAVPPPSAFTAAAWAFAALAPVTATSAFSCAAVPWAGMFGGAVDDAAGVGLGLAALAAVEASVAAIPMAVPASSEPAIAALTKSLFDLNANCIHCLLSDGLWLPADTGQPGGCGLAFDYEKLRLG